jgi:hypothetical protein
MIRALRTPDALADFTVLEHSHDGATRRVYRLGDGPGVVLIHELPGITPECARLARRLASEGFTVVMPSLFGEPGRPFTAGYVASTFARICVAGEFAGGHAIGFMPEEKPKCFQYGGMSECGKRRDSCIFIHICRITDMYFVSTSVTLRSAK